MGALSLWLTIFFILLTRLAPYCSSQCSFFLGGVLAHTPYLYLLNKYGESMHWYLFKIEISLLNKCWNAVLEKGNTSKKNLCKLWPYVALNSWPSSSTPELSQGHLFAFRFALRPQEHSAQLYFFGPRLRVGGYTEVPANTLLGLLQLLGLSEVTVSTVLVRGPWSAARWMKPKTHVLADCDL